MIIFKTFQGLENFYIKFQDFPYVSRICTNPVVCLRLDAVLLINEKDADDGESTVIYYSISMNEAGDHIRHW